MEWINISDIIPSEKDGIILVDTFRTSERFRILVFDAQNIS